MITGFGPKALSARPPIHEKTAAEIAEMMPKTPISITDQPSTPVA